MKKVIIRIGGMSCAACSNTIEKYLLKQKGIIDCNVNLVTEEAFIIYDEVIDINDIEKYINETGYKFIEKVDEEKEKNEKKKKKTNLIIFGILFIFAFILSMLHKFMSNNSFAVGIILCTLSILFLIYGSEIIISGIKKIFIKLPNMDTLVTMGVISSLLYSLYNLIKGNYNYLYFESAITIIYFIKLGRYIENNSKEKTQNMFKDLVTLTPKTALLENGKKVKIDEIEKGDIIISKEEDVIAVDGKIVSGEVYIDETFITGESMPSKKIVNDMVLAGSKVISGNIKYEAINIGRNSSISEIVRLVIEGFNTKMKMSKIADKVSSFFIPIILIISVLTFIFNFIFLGFNTALISFVNVLVISCPCALGLATPLAVTISKGYSLKNGILIKKSEVLENVNDCNTIVFDKTGTLTNGNLKIFKIYNFSSYKDNEVIKKVSSIEHYSSHPISSAFISKNLYDVKKFKEIEGIGITGKIDNKEIFIGSNKLITKLDIHNSYKNYELLLENEACSIVYVIENKKIISLIGVKDKVKDGAFEVIDKLKELGKEIIILTGDNKKTASVIAKELKIDKVISDVLPKDKVSVIKKLSKDGKKVMMVGDGINDAPSLSYSTVSVSVSNAVDAAANASDVVLLSNNLNKIVLLFNISKRTIRNIKQNLFWAFFYNILMIPIASNIFKEVGLTINPMIAGIFMTLSSLFVVFNALRLKNN